MRQPSTAACRCPVLMSQAFFWFTLLVMVFGVGTVRSSEKTEHYNRLVHEKSPYLTQHANNPIWWYPWGEEAFAAAKRENKPIFLSIGYSTCHWCHVMEGDSFENEEVADLMNKHFISIKVDREERPDVDQIYMDVLAAMNGRGGWPMSLFLSPERVPFMGDTFVPRAQFILLLRRISDTWKNDRAKIDKIVGQVSAWLDKQRDRGFVNAPVPDDHVFQRFAERHRQSFDPEYGGFSKQPKFPQSTQLSLLLRIYKRSADPAILELVTKTLDGMARGGMFDQLGGGFHRYSTDAVWGIPHFEKMLYTQALLAVTYLEAYQVTQNPEYALVAQRVLDYLLRDMSRPDGGFYSAEDADSEKTEGKFYVWTENQLKQVLSEDEFKAVAASYNVTAKGNFNPDDHVRELEDSAGMKALSGANAFFVRLGDKLPDGSDATLASAKQKLMKIRSTRIRPDLDDKILTAWNGLAIRAMAVGYQVLGDPRYQDAGQKTAAFLLKKLRTKDGRLLRSWRNGSAKYPAYLNDYAYLIEGLTTLYQTDFDLRWYNAALSLQGHQDRLFLDGRNGGYFFSDGTDLSLLQRKKTFHDTALPSGNGVSALNLLKLGDLSLSNDFKQHAGRIIAADGLKVVGTPEVYVQILIALEYLLDSSKEVAVIGPLEHPATKRTISYLHRTFLPNKVISVGLPVEEDGLANMTIPLIFNKPMLKGQPTTYVCENNICQLPTSNFEKIKTFTATAKTYSWYQSELSKTE